MTSVNSLKDPILMKKTIITTPLGDMVIIGGEEALCLIDFVDNSQLDQKIERLMKVRPGIIEEGGNEHIYKVKQELSLYFTGHLTHFQVPLYLTGTDFQKDAWCALRHIPYSHTWTYNKQAEFIKNPTAYRAVASANGANFISIVLPCHRVVQQNRQIGGYAGGERRKAWLISHEKRHTKCPEAMAMFHHLFI